MPKLTSCQWKETLLDHHGNLLSTRQLYGLSDGVIAVGHTDSSLGEKFARASFKLLHGPCRTREIYEKEK